jgi:hypothetical protein
LKSVKVAFKNGAFHPVENGVSIPEGSEGIAVFVPASPPEEEKPNWWNELPLEEKQKKALLFFSKKLLNSVFPLDVKVTCKEKSFEVFVLVENDLESIKPVMDIALEVYEGTGVYIPVQVISTRRLSRWKERGSSVYETITGGISLK